MLSSEIKKIKKFTYLELCNYLLKKYGKVQGNYFVNDNFLTKNHKIMRGNEGLFVHHIKESEAVMLNDTKYAKMFPAEYQNAENLIYCNYLEHIILHYKIMQEYLSEDSILQTKCVVGLGGLINHLLPIINDYFLGYIYKRTWQIQAFSLIENNYNDYLDILHDVVTLFREKDICRIAREYLKVNFDTQMFIIRPFYGKIIKENKILKDYTKKYS